MKSRIIITSILLLQLINTLNAQDRTGFTIQKLTMNGIEMDAIGTAIFNKKHTELEIKQRILPRNGKSPKNQKYKTTKFRLVGTLSEEVVGDSINCGVHLSGTAYDKNNAHFDFFCILSKKECKLNLFSLGMEYYGKIIPD